MVVSTRNTGNDLADVDACTPYVLFRRKQDTISSCIVLRSRTHPRHTRHKLQSVVNTPLPRLTDSHKLSPPRTITAVRGDYEPTLISSLKSFAACSIWPQSLHALTAAFRLVAEGTTPTVGISFKSPTACAHWLPLPQAAMAAL